MSEETMEINELIHAKEPQTPGELLRRARLQLGYSESDVALHLHLSKSVVEVLENNQFQKLPALTFAKGYLRSYAKLVQISPEVVLEAFGKLGLKDKEHSFPQRNKIIKEFKASDGPVRWISYTILAALAALVVIWWHNHNANSDMLVNKIRVTPMASPATASTEESSTSDQNQANPDTASAYNGAQQAPQPLNLMPSILMQQNNPAVNNMNTLPEQDNGVNSSSSSDTRPHEGKKQFQQWKNPDLD